VAEHLLGHLEVGYHAVFRWPDRGDVGRGAPEIVQLDSPETWAGDPSRDPGLDALEPPRDSRSEGTSNPSLPESPERQHDPHLGSTARDKRPASRRIPPEIGRYNRF
jgi:hypothetical protein